MPDPLEVVRSHFGYPGFRPGQEPLVRAVLAGRDALGILPTGGGKTLCYLVPAALLPGLTLVVTPLVSLMADQVRRAREIGLRAAHLTAHHTAGEKRRIAAAAAAGDLDVLLVAPERLGTRTFLDQVPRERVVLLTVDEAHCIAQWGHDFRPAYLRIGEYREGLSAPCLALTATATPDVRGQIRRSLGLRRPVEVVRSFDRPNLEWAVQKLDQEGGRGRWLRSLLAMRAGPAIVYAPSRKITEAGARVLAGQGIRAAAYHAGLDGPRRSEIQDRFMSGGLRVVVATNAFGMGIDKPDVRTVAHLALPRSLEAFYQEAGRGGRDGQTSLSVAIQAPADRLTQLGLLSASAPPTWPVRRLWKHLNRAGSGHGAPSDSAPWSAIPPAALRPRAVGPGRSGTVPSLPLLEALARIGALEWRPGPGTSHGPAGSLSPGAEYRLLDPRPDWGALRRRRREEIHRLRAVDGYARSRTCRRARILRYFGESETDSCGGCDRCGMESRLPPVP